MIEYCNGFMFAYIPSTGFIGQPGWKVSLIRKNSGWQEGMLNGIGGKREPGEAFVDAMVREFKEETGCETFKRQWTCTVILQGFDWRVHFFKAFCPADRLPARRDCDEGRIEVHWVDKLLEDQPIPNLHWLIPMQFDNLSWPIEIHDKGGVESGKPKRPDLPFGRGIVFPVTDVQTKFRMDACAFCDDDHYGLPYLVNNRSELYWEHVNPTNGTRSVCSRYGQGHSIREGSLG